ncbi:uncharacterized protein EV422DRAFT_359281 [Fimicolochytrium jonesii]|uniref:uncharacterized protein n=1 Tax=Fimicolochytrium jonesii TaxID=1396493 RepID=UPI0022FDDF38|nr:uncharacterized protein EV422DRAFT_359281 [Fimicolochytrium jonesii]KAI8823531.1 hypothetical protein EV422DRAFT_359281 [Fimicolochytrium jonesii]
MAKKRGRPNWEGDDSGADESEPETSLARPPKRRQTTSAWWGRPFSSVVSALSNLLWTPDAVAPNGASESGTEGVRVYTLSSVTVERTERGPDAGVVTGTCSDVEEDVTSASIVSRCGTRIIITPPSDTASVVDLDSDEETVATVPISECFEEVVEEEIQETRTETVLGEEEKAAADEPITLDDLIEEEPSTRVERDTVGGDRVIHKEPEVIVIDDDSDCVPSVDIEPPTSPHSTEADEAKRLPSDIPSRDDGYHPFFEPQRTGRPAKRDDNSQPDSLQRLNGDSHVEYPSPEDSPEKGAKSFSNAATPNAGIRTLRRNEEKENFMGRQSVFTVRSQDSSLAGSTASSFGRSSLSRSILKPKVMRPGYPQCAACPHFNLPSSPRKKGR